MKYRQLIRYFKENNNADIQLFFFHSAGGSSSNYKNLITKFSSKFEIILVELAGRGTRSCESLPTTLQQVIEDLSIPIYKTINKNFIFFGHSMGAHIALHLLSYLSSKFKITPLFFVSSGANPPQYITKNGFKSSPTDTFFELLYDIINYGSIPRYLMKEPDFVNYIIKIYRSDLKICHNFKNTPAPLISCPIIAVNGNNDKHINTQIINQWKQITSNSFESYLTPGQHFYFYGNESQLANIITCKYNYLLKKD